MNTIRKAQTNEACEKIKARLIQGEASGRELMDAANLKNHDDLNNLFITLETLGIMIYEYSTNTGRIIYGLLRG